MASINFKEKVKELQNKAMLRGAEENGPDILTHDKRSITQSNSLTRASQNLSLAEKRIIYMAISEIHPIIKSDKKTYRIHAIDYSSLFSVKRQTAYKILKEAGSNLFERYWVTVEEKSKTKYRWLEKITYKEEEGELEITFTEDTLKNLQLLRTQFTSYPLKEVADFNSKYTWRLYEILSGFKQGNNFEGWFSTSVSDLKVMLDLPETYKTAMLKTRIIDGSIKEIQEKCGIVIVYEEKKKGRKIEGFRFTFAKIETEEPPEKT